MNNELVTTWSQRCALDGSGKLTLDLGSWRSHLVDLHSVQVILVVSETVTPEFTMFGKEAEELRAGVEKIMECGDLGEENMVDELQRLLDRVDARDSLRFLEVTDEAQKTCDRLRAIRKGTRGSVREKLESEIQRIEKAHGL